MNPSWQTWLTLALQVVVIVAPALLLTSRVRSVIWQRTVWQSVLLLLAGLLLAEGCAAGPWLVEKFQSLRTPAPVPFPELKANVTTTVIAEAVPLSAPAVDEEITKPFPVEAPHVVAEAPTPPVVAHSPFYSSFAWLLWWTGAGLFLLRLIVGRIFLLRFGQRLNPVMEVGLFDRVQALAVTLSLHRRVLVLESPRLVTPVVFGLWQPTIVVPDRFTTDFTPAQQESILAHELAHLAARDPLWYCLADVVAALLWWHPLVWLARNRLQLASELAADEASLIHVRGPETLAECLVQFGQRLTRPRAIESIGIEGQGFRSRLGQRVERLLQLRANDNNTPRRWRTRAVRFGTFAVLLPLLMFATGWISPGADQRPWRSVGQEAWANFWTSLKPPTLLAAVIARPQTTVKPVAQTRPVVPPAPKPVSEPAALKMSPIVSGRVFLQGVPPPERTVNLPAEQAKLRGSPLMTHFYRTSTDHGLQDVLVYVKRGLEGRRFPIEPAKHTLEMKGFEFVPYVLAMRAGQTLRITNLDAALNDVHFSPNNPANQEWNCALMSGAQTIERVISAPELFARLKTDIFPWMYAYVCAVDHPYFAVTDAEGRFTFPQPLPPGHYTLAAVHRKAGEVLQEINVSESNGPTLNLTLSVPSVTNLPAATASTNPVSDPDMAARRLKLIQHAKAENLIKQLFPNETETSLKKILGVDPKSDEALSVLSLIALERAKTNGTFTAIQADSPAPKSSQMRVRTFSSVDTVRFQKRLESIVLPRVEFKNERLADVVTKLAREARRFDPAKEGVVMLINSHAGTNQTAIPDLADLRITLEPPLTDVSLHQVLQAIAASTSREPYQGLNLVVEDYAVVFGWYHWEPPPLYTRLFKVDADAFPQGLLNLNTAGSGTSRPLSSSTNAVERIKDLLGRAGVSFSSSNADASQLFYNDRTGMLMVRATLADMQIVERFLETASLSAPQITIDAQYVEIPEKIARQMGLQWFAADLSPSLNQAALAEIKLTGSIPTNENVRVERPEVSNHVSVLSDNQVEALLQKLKSKEGVRVTGTPRITTLHARQAQVSIQEISTLVVGMTNQLVKGTNGQPDQMVRLYDTAPLGAGPELDLIPKVLPDGRTLQLQWVFRVTEFLGYDKAKNKADQPHPHLRVRQVSNINTLRDGQTLLVGCGAESDPAKEKSGGLFHFSGSKEKRYTLVFLTPRIVDISGTPVHSE